MTASRSSYPKAHKITAYETDTNVVYYVGYDPTNQDVPHLPVYPAAVDLLNKVPEPAVNAPSPAKPHAPSRSVESTRDKKSACIRKCHRSPSPRR